jgi:hypothetical protein
MSEESQEGTATAEATAEKETETTESQETTSEAGSEKQEQDSQPTEFTLTVPDGYEMSDEGKSDYMSFVDELNKLPEADRAQAMLDKHLSSVSNSQEAREAMHQEWAKESMNDKEFGGANLQENMIAARRTMNSFSDPATDANGKPVLHQDGTMKGQQMTEIEVFMNETGYGNHPSVIRMVHRMTQAMSEDHRFVMGNMKPRENKKTPAEVMYPNMNK